MQYCLLMASPHRKGNTAAILEPFLKELESQGATGETFWLYDKKIEPCTGCRSCQSDWNNFACVINDDMQKMVPSILSCDLIILATPIYSWYCTAPMKAALDRLVYGMNKYYGEKKGPSLWLGKKLVAITTCGYPPEKGSDLFSEGLKRYAKHSGLLYGGMLTERDPGKEKQFLIDVMTKNAENFASEVLL
ncbi:MAG: flavodoxin family protein [Eubacteriales bacterium]|nr:flavodoxin family protein [Eubacteriales bacterium]MDD3349225.1 flavodoxin family protein [Eubacteriales bacterium]